MQIIILIEVDQQGFGRFMSSSQELDLQSNGSKMSWMEEIFFIKDLLEQAGFIV